MSEILPPDQDDFLLQQLGEAQMQPRDLAEAGTEVMKHFGWNLQEYGESIERLAEQGFVKASVQKDGSGKFASVFPRSVTGPGWYRIKTLRVDPEE